MPTFGSGAAGKGPGKPRQTPNVAGAGVGSYGGTGGSRGVGTRPGGMSPAVRVSKTSSNAFGNPSSVSRAGRTNAQPGVAGAASPTKSGLGNYRTMSRGGSGGTGSHYSPNNANVPMTVVGREDGEDGRTMLTMEGEGGGTARLPFDPAEAEAYPDGSAIVLHCVPQEEEAEAEISEAAEEGPPMAVTTRKIPKSMRMGAVLDAYHKSKEA